MALVLLYETSKAVLVRIIEELKSIARVKLSNLCVSPHIGCVFIDRDSKRGLKNTFLLDAGPLKEEVVIDMLPPIVYGFVI